MLPVAISTADPLRGRFVGLGGNLGFAINAPASPFGSFIVNGRGKGA